MTSVRDHYDRHLGPIYGWMLGDFAAAVAGNVAELTAAGVGSAAGARAVDVGAGNGASSMALEALGYDVVAVDPCAGLLDELRAHAAGRRVTPVLGDATALPSLWSPPAAVVTCLGDTLTHLDSLERVRRFLGDAAAALAPGGTFVATFRDYTRPPLQGAARFLPVRADDRRILTCFLEYRDDVVLVHDLLHERRDGRWELTVSAYPKLRLAPDLVREVLAGAGLDVTVAPGARGMVRLAARRPNAPDARSGRAHRGRGAGPGAGDAAGPT